MSSMGLSPTRVLRGHRSHPFFFALAVAAAANTACRATKRMPSTGAASAAPSAASASVAPSNGPPQSMLLVVLDPWRPSEEEKTVVGYVAGMSAPVELMTTSGGALRWNCIHQNRFLVSHDAEAFDLGRRTSVDLSASGSWVHACDANAIVLGKRCGGALCPVEVVALERDSGRPIPIPASPRWTLVKAHRLDPDSRELSPDGTKQAFFDPPGAAALMVRGADGLARKLADGFDHSVSPIVSPSTPEALLAWIDDGRILTQKSNGHLVTVSLDGVVTTLARVPAAALPTSQPLLDRDPDGRLVYRCDGKSYVVDVEGEQLMPLTDERLGFGFRRTPPGYAQGAIKLWHGDALVWEGRCGSFFEGVPTDNAVAIECDHEVREVVTLSSGKPSSTRIGVRGKAIGWVRGAWVRGGRSSQP